jgi:deoxyadenosine/deoxycytidine kinase
MELYNTMKTALQPPDLLIYLKCDVRSIRNRIKSRGRNSEQSIPVSYIRRLNGLYDSWVERYDQSPVLVWDSGKLDYLTDLVDRIEFERALDKLL